MKFMRSIHVMVPEHPVWLQSNRLFQGFQFSQNRGMPSDTEDSGGVFSG